MTDLISKAYKSDKFTIYDVQCLDFLIKWEKTPEQDTCLPGKENHMNLQILSHEFIEKEFLDFYEVHKPWELPLMVDKLIQEARWRRKQMFMESLQRLGKYHYILLKDFKDDEGCFTYVEITNGYMLFKDDFA